MPRHGRFLWTPTDEIPKRVGRRRMTPALYREWGLGERIGKLRFVAGRHAGTALLVAEYVPIRDKAGRALRVPKSGRVARGRSRVRIVAFIGVRRTRRQRRVSLGAIGKRWMTQMVLLMREELKRTR